MKRKRPNPRALAREARKKARQRKRRKGRAAVRGPRPPAVQQRGDARPADNTTCDVYFDPNVPPASADVAGVACHLAARFAQGAEASEGDQALRWTHLLYVDSAVDVRDDYPNTPANRVYVPDSTGTGFDVVFVETINRGTPAAYRRVYLDRRQPTWPTDQL
jgi:hypothetical protein